MYPPGWKRSNGPIILGLSAVHATGVKRFLEKRCAAHTTDLGWVPRSTNCCLLSDDHGEAHYP